MTSVLRPPIGIAASQSVLKRSTFNILSALSNRRCFSTNVAVSSQSDSNQEEYDSKTVDSMNMSSESVTERQDSSSFSSNLPPQKKKILSAEEALFLAKQAGFYTKKELQEQIIRSPPFSKSKSPMLLDAFLKPLGVEEEEVLRDSQNQTRTEFLNDSESLDSNLNPNQNDLTDPANTTIPQKIHDTLKRMSKSAHIQSFRDPRTGFEWLTRAEGQGTRARATAKVVIKRGTGKIKVNGEEDFTSRWPLFYNRMEICIPFQETSSAGLFDVFISVKGGGTSGQAGAARLAIARALYAARPNCLAELESRDLLFEDTRQVLSKEAGLRKARAKYRWVKR